MHRSLPFILLVFFLLSCENQERSTLESHVAKVKEIQAPPEKNQVKLDKKDRIDLAWKHDFEMTKDPKTGKVPLEELAAAREYLKREQIRLSSDPARAGIAGISWEERGPSNVPGRTRAFLFDASDGTNNTVFAGSVAGGLWKTSDFQAGTPSWTHQNEFWNNLAVSAIVQDPSNSNTIYVGTGEGWSNADAVVGQGIWKTTNGGTSFSQLANSTFINYVNDLEVASNGDLYVATRFFGLLKSTNGGTTYTTVLSTAVAGLDLSGASLSSANDRMGDLEIGADGDLYVSSYGEVWKSDAATYGANTGNAGNWVRIFPPTAGTGSGSSIDRLEMAVAPSDANRLYILGEGVGSNDVTEMYRSENVSGNPLTTAPTYTTLTIPTIIDQGAGSIFTRSQAWYDLIAQVDPNNADNLYIGGIDALRSTDKGVSWTQITTWSLFAAVGYGSAQNVHADHHNIIFEPGSSTNAVITSDGGIDYSTDINNTVSFPSFVTKGIGYNTTQFYSCAMNPDALSNEFLAGSQDNGTQQFSTAGINVTTEATGGDGGFCHIDQTNSNTQLTATTRNNYRRSLNGGASFSSIFSNSSVGKFINPSDYDDTNNILYASYGAAGTVLRLSNIEGSISSVTFNLSGLSVTTHEVSAITVSPNTPSTIYLGLDTDGITHDGDVFRVDNANGGSPTITRILTSSTLTNASGYVSSIAIEEGDENHILVTYSNYGLNSVWESTNGGTSWSNREGDLPNIPVRWAMFAPGQSNQALIATELGVWSTDELDEAGGTDWDPTNTALANVRTDMLQTRNSDNLIIAATHGRGLYSTNFYSTPTINFAVSSQNVSEAGASGSLPAPDDCLDYQDYTVDVTISQNPTVDADVAITVLGTSSATENVDFEVSPTSFSFTGAGAKTQTLTIRVFDDGDVESIEDINLQVSLTNGGVTDAVIGSASESSLNIIDNDLAPDPSTTFNTVGAGGFFATSNSPFRGDLEDRKIQYLYDAADITASGLSAGLIKGLAIQVFSKASTQPYQNFTISLGHTSLTTNPGSPFDFEATEQTVFTGNVTTFVGWNFFEFDAPFVWDGTSSILVEMCFDNSTVTGSDAIIVSDLTGTGNYHSWYDNVTTGSGCAFTTFNFISFLQPQIRFYDAVETLVEDQLESTEQYLGPNETVYFYSSGGDLICRIDNGSHDFGCTTVEIDRSSASAGAAGVSFWQTSGTTNHLVAKTLEITPTNNSGSASYDLTVYFTQPELDDWAVLTGNTINDIKFVKTNNGIKISDVVPGNGNNNSNIDSAASTNSAYGSGYSLTASFTDGFSGFGFGLPGTPPTPTPVEFINFAASLEGEAIQLDWATGSEANNKGFFIERSLDGENFDDLGFVEGVGNSSETQFYGYKDKDLGLGNRVYTYRLRQEDFDGTTDFSDQVEVFVPALPLNFVIVHSSQTSQASILFNQVPMTEGNVDVYGLNGQKVGTVYEGKLEQQRIDLSVEGLSNGVYLVKVALADGTSLIRKWIHRN